MVLRGTDSTDSDGTIDEFFWYLNEQYINGQSTFTHVFDQPGDYVIRLDVTDNNGETSSASLIVKINPPTDNSASGVVIGDIDDSQATSEPAMGASGGTDQPKGIWVEDGALKVPGFEAVFAIMGLMLVSWYVHRGKEE